MMTGSGSWEKRYFALPISGSVLSYYASPHEFLASRPALGSVECAGSVVFLKKAKDGGVHRFTIKSNGAHTHGLKRATRRVAVARSASRSAAACSLLARACLLLAAAAPTSSLLVELPRMNRARAQAQGGERGRVRQLDGRHRAARKVGG